MIPNQQRKRAAVIGAGPGGLAAAMLLSGQGYEVDVYEKQPVIGGRSARLELGEYRFDRGATFLMMPQLIEEMFDVVGRKLSDYVELKELTPLYALNFGDKVFTPSRNREEVRICRTRCFGMNRWTVTVSWCWISWPSEHYGIEAVGCVNSVHATAHRTGYTCPSRVNLWHLVQLGEADLYASRQ
ncbi:NAD(P)-binding protein [Paenibacillus pabuli]|uniref:NAD(P)-binding protein n=1 Tax=Paenibacillus pabuli TaxID=1472 RepID=UPI000782ABA8|nr:NAD(P)-binding protein [Paenibacillus pabuli]MEC0126273.1 NAD(P)-binding protein [Paenibacillus pabuli]